MELKIEMLKGLIAFTNDISTLEITVTHVLSERELMLTFGQQTIHITGSLYDRFRSTVTLNDVVALYESIGFQ